MTEIIIEYRFQQLLSIVTPNTRSPTLQTSISLSATLVNKLY